VLSIFLGIEVISNVPAVLHTPLMSGANAIHGVVIIGAIIVMGHADNTLAIILGFLGCCAWNTERGWRFCGYRQNAGDV
jgi:NAD(P) transhydrogenase subunit alpha